MYKNINANMFAIINILTSKFMPDKFCINKTKRTIFYHKIYFIKKLII